MPHLPAILIERPRPSENWGWNLPDLASYSKKDLMSPSAAWHHMNGATTQFQCDIGWFLLWKHTVVCILSILCDISIHLIYSTFSNQNAQVFSVFLLREIQAVLVPNKTFWSFGPFLCTERRLCQTWWKATTWMRCGRRRLSWRALSRT